ncbi:MAG TPA: DUF433 domain-containing protein [Candidatus Binatia bacterium]|nr:DUF433 domain-containing protein [Candidatus Binatia bacterium]
MSRPTKSQDPRELPAYGLSEAAHYLRIPRATLRAWVMGRSYPKGSGLALARPLFHLPKPGQPVLSFLNLVEAHVLDAIRREHQVSLQRVRKALDLLLRHVPSRHPLADQQFATSGLDLFVERYGELINLSRDGQLAMREVLAAHLKRIDHDPSGVPIRLFPFTRNRELEEPLGVVIDPFVSFGRPVLHGTGIPTAVVAERYKAGESIDSLAVDYGRSRLEIEEAIRCELEVDAA